MRTHSLTECSVLDSHLIKPATRTRRRFLRQLGGVAFAATWGCYVPVQATEQRKPRLLFFIRPGAYEPDIVHRENCTPSVSEQMMVNLSHRIGYEVECSADGRIFDSDLGRFDAFVLFWNFDPMKPNKTGDFPLTASGKNHLLDAVASGRGLVGIHCAAYAILSGPQQQCQTAAERDPYVKMLGGELWECLPKQKCRYRLVSPNFPGISALKTMEITLDDEPYGLKNYSEDIHVIAVQETAGLKGPAFERPAFPCVWARHHGRGRVFYMAMGHGIDAWQTEEFQNILSAGLNWASGRIEANLPSNLSLFHKPASTFTPPKGMQQ